MEDSSKSLLLSPDGRITAEGAGQTALRNYMVMRARNRPEVRDA